MKLILTLGLAVVLGGCVVHSKGHGPHHGPPPPPHHGPPHTDAVIVIPKGHVHDGGCGHYQHKGKWHHAPGHVHKHGCGHTHRDGIWIVID